MTALPYPDGWSLQLIELCGPEPHSHGRAACRTPGKRPLRRDWTTQPQRAGAEPARRRALLEQHLAQGKNIGLAIPRGVIVLDADTPEAAAALREAIPDGTPVQATGRGIHAVLGIPTDLELDQSAGQRIGIGSGVSVDTRTAGRGQIVVAPSVHASGHGYRWEVPLPESTRDLPTCPAQWLKQLRRRERPSGSPEDAGESVGRNAALYRLTRSLKAKGCALGETLAALRAVNQERYAADPLPDSELKQMVRGAFGQANREGFGEGKERPLSGFAHRWAQALAAPINSAAIAATEPPPQPMLIANLVPERVSTLLSGRGGVGKGFVQLEMAICLALGVEFAGQWVREAAPVVLCSWEDDRAELERRLHYALAEKFPGGLPAQAAAQLDRNLTLVDLFGSGVALTPETVQQIVEAMKGLGGRGLLALDPLGKFWDSEWGEMNAQAGAGQFHAACDRIVSQTGFTVMTAVHHSKDAIKSGRELVATAVSGTQQLVDLSRCQIAVAEMSPESVKEKGLDPDEQYIELTQGKVNSAARFRIPLVFQRCHGGAVRHVPGVEPKSRAELDMDAALAALSKASRPLTREEWDAVSPMGQKRNKRARGGLLDAGRVVEIKGENGSKKPRFAPRNRGNSETPRAADCGGIARAEVTAPAKINGSEGLGDSEKLPGQGSVPRQTSMESNTSARAARTPYGGLPLGVAAPAGRCSAKAEQQRQAARRAEEAATREAEAEAAREEAERQAETERAESQRPEPERERRPRSVARARGAERGATSTKRSRGVTPVPRRQGSEAPSPSLSPALHKGDAEAPARARSPVAGSATRHQHPALQKTNADEPAGPAQ